MWGATILITGFIALPAIFMRWSSSTLNFYWRGFWAFLCLIFFVAGGGTAMMMLGIDILREVDIVLGSILAAYMAFVVFAWFRLSGLAVLRLWQARRSLNALNK